MRDGSRQDSRRIGRKSEGTGTDSSILEHPCVAWKHETASRLAVVIDGEDYFKALRVALASARKQVMFIGWDFDIMMEFLPGQSNADGMAPDRRPNALGPFLEALCEEREDLDVYLLKWNGAVVIAPGSVIPSIALAYFGKDQVHFALDSHHPTGACHHQKIVVIDDTLAFCGGIDATVGRWDTSEHLPDEPRRRDSAGTQLKPWHDVACAVTGDAARALGELSRARWKRATGDTLEEPGTGYVPEWPDILHTLLTDVPVAISRTEPPFDESELINEIEHVTLAAIGRAERIIYIESQYLAAESILRAIEARLREPDGPEVVVLNPKEGEHFIEHSAMHSTRGRWLARLRRKYHRRFRCYHPVNGGDEPIYVHAKVLVVDDDFVKIGSSNINDRSLGFDTECDLCFAAANEEQRDVILGLMARLVSEHVDGEVEAVVEMIRSERSVIAAIDAFNPPDGRRLVDIPVEPESILDTILANYKLLDPRFHVGERTDAGEGLRPRHLVLMAAVVGVAAFLWKRSRRDG